MAFANKPHAVCIPFPMQSHIKYMLTLAKLLHHRGFHITFVNTEYNHKRLLKSRGPHALDGLPHDFQFKTIPDGLPPSDNIDATQDAVALCDSIMKNNFSAPFIDLLVELNQNQNVPSVTNIVSDACMMFTITASHQLGIPVFYFFTIAACSFMGITQLKDKSFVQSTDPNDLIGEFSMKVAEVAPKATAVIVHTFDALEQDALDALSSILPRLYTVGPLQLLLNNITEDPLKSLGYNLWKEDNECLQWLNTKQPDSVLYVSFGSTTTMTHEQLVEFGMGLANSKHPFLWIIRPDLVIGESAMLPPEFLAETRERGMISSWCPQEEVLKHPSIGGFLTHCGWGSVIESLSAGVPMLCWPVFGDQLTNCRYTCVEWGIGMEIDKNVKRNEVEELVKELMEGERGKKMKKKAMEWKALAAEAASPGGSSSVNLDKLVNMKF